MHNVQAADRIQRLPQQFFADLVKQTMQLIAAGHDVINLGQGNPDQPTPPHIVQHLREAALDPATHKYPPFDGLKMFKEAAAAWYARRYNVDVDPSTEIAVLIGAKLALGEISLCYLNKGDVCLVPDPGFPDYWSGVALAGGVHAPLPLSAERNFLPDFAAVPKEVVDKTRLLLLNYPSNPTGAVAPLACFEESVEFGRRNGIVVVHDLAYGDLVFDDQPPVSFLQARGAKDVGIEFVTLSKSYNMAGWRIGFAAGNKEIIRTLEILQDHLNCSQFPAIQHAAALALTGPQECVQELKDLYEQRRNAWLQACRQIGWEIPRPAGSFFVWCPTPPGITAQEMSQRVLEEAKVVTAPGIAFGKHGEGYIRISLTAPAERLVEAAQRIGQLGLFA